MADPSRGVQPAAGGPPPESETDIESLVFPKVKKRRKGPYAADDCGGEPPAMFLKGIHEFNEGEFFEQHETPSPTSATCTRVCC
jgi:hypothetical protein